VSRCGWCIGDDHANCVVVVELGRSKSGKLPITYWRCSCSEGKHPRTKCLDCNRRNVEVGQNWRCKDQLGCARYIKEHGRVKPTRPAQDRDWRLEGNND
jgi:hypothetical protein